MSTENNDQNGMHCPRCQFKIKFQINDLLLKNQINCPGCHLQMDMDVPGEIKVHLQEIQLAQDMVENARKMNL